MKTRGRPRHPGTLTPRQAEVFALLRQGLTNEEIASRLRISVDGVKYHVSDILLRLGVNSRYEAATIDLDKTPARWALLAPLFALRRPRWSILGQAAGAVVIVAAVAGAGALLWGVLASDDGDRGGDVARQQGAIETGNSATDALIALLQAQDVEALLDRVEFLPGPCSADGSQYQLPPCPAGVADGTDVPGFANVVCEGAFVTTRDEIRPGFAAAFTGSSRSAVYAVGRGGLVKNANPYDVIVLTSGAVPSATAPATLWYATGEGRIVRMQAECGPLGAAQMAEAQGLGGIGYVVPPQASCATADVRITIEVAGVSQARPQIIGRVNGAVSDERVIVTAFDEDELGFQSQRTPAARVPAWSGGPAGRDDVVPGMILDVDGIRRTDCVIDATSIAAR